MTTLTYTIDELIPYISWAYFFHAWQIAPRFASVTQVHGCTACRTAWLNGFSADDKPQAQVAMELYAEAEAMLRTLAAEGEKVVARFAILPCRSDGDDLVFEDQWRLPCLRQQRVEGVCLCLSDYVLPQGSDKGDGVNDRVGLFATTAGRVGEYDMLRQTLLDRLAEAAAEKMHEQVRKTYWGYAPDEHLTMTELHSERFQGIRPAIGYPCLPDQRVIFPIYRRLRLNEVGIALTETGAMNPHASTCGLLLAHPATRYFAVGNISPEQQQLYEQRLQACLQA
ncbi:MAG: 5-methyltetrahydrofolate--homocysteine methyltransferase [Bacteroidaceae bacterium]|nr:5-methyltetrahydrofolate--homocysteine methyltransferase [Bacteroidaceae bacterium]